MSTVVSTLLREASGRKFSGSLLFGSAQTPITNDNLKLGPKDVVIATPTGLLIIDNDAITAAEVNFEVEPVVEVEDVAEPDSEA
jgi:hypothetical protein